MATTVQNILDDIDARYPNDSTNAEKLVWMNTAIDKLYSNIGCINITEIDTVEDTGIYTLPTGVKMENIISLTVSIDDEDGSTETNQREYQPLRPTDDLRNYTYFHVKEGYFGIYPEPEEDDRVIRITYRKETSTLTTSDLSENLEDDLDKDYYEAIKLYVLFILCEVDGNTAEANNYRTRYNAEMANIKIDEYTKLGKFPTVRDVTKKPSRTRRFRRGLNNKITSPGNGVVGGWY